MLLDAVPFCNGRIGLRPTYYCCMDPDICEHHKEAIARLVENHDVRGIKMIFLHDRILNHYPDLTRYGRVVLSESLH